MTPDRLVPSCGDYRCTLPEHQRPRGPSLASSLQARTGASQERDASAAAGPSRGGASSGQADDRAFLDKGVHGRPPTRMARKWMAHEVMPGFSGRAATGTDRAGFPASVRGHEQSKRHKKAKAAPHTASGTSARITRAEGPGRHPRQVPSPLEPAGEPDPETAS